MEHKLSKQAEDALLNPPYTVEDLVERLDSMSEEKLATFGIVPRQMLVQYIRQLEARV